MYAWKRFWARSLDSIFLTAIVFVCWGIAMNALGLVDYTFSTHGEIISVYQDDFEDVLKFKQAVLNIILVLIVELFTVLLFFLYHAFCISKFNTTLGKYALGLYVVKKQDDSQITFDMALRREWNRFVSAKWGIVQIVLFSIVTIGVIIVALTKSLSIFFIVLSLISLLRQGEISTIPMYLTYNYLQKYGETKYDKGLDLQIVSSKVNLIVVCLIIFVSIVLISLIIMFFVFNIIAEGFGLK